MTVFEKARNPIPPDPESGGGGGGSWINWLVTLLIATVTIWTTITGTQWLVIRDGNPSLEEVLHNQWAWAESITITEGQKKARKERAWIAVQTKQAIEMKQYEPNDGDVPRYRRMYKILIPMATGSWNEPNKRYMIRENRVEEHR